MSDLSMSPVSRPFTATITPPGSKSLTNRAMVLAALARGRCTLRNVLFADDTEVMIDCLQRLGFTVRVDRATHTVTVDGLGGEIPTDSAELYCGNSGTTIRFVAAMLSVGKGRFVLDGNPRMRQRPIRGLIDILKNLGVRAHFPVSDGYPPVEILADGLPGGLLTYGSEQSSQYLSAVLMAAPYARQEVVVDLVGQQTSWPYVAMTMRLMDVFGLTPELERDTDTGEPKQIVIPRGRYHGTEYDVEPDASNASYFLAVAAVHPGASVTVTGLGKDSLQGDVGFADVLHRMGAGLDFKRDSITITGPQSLEGVDVDLLAMPDMAQTLAVTALFATGPTHIRGLHTLKVKETDRIEALATELRKLGAEVEATGDSLTITPPREIRTAEIHTYDDHRMAMSFAIAGTRAQGVTIKDVECTNKTYPNYFADLARVVG
ncbi:MAG: 3-phosphoshikimate 1-carboxyvinyltransferase [Phycisphaerae bacterium]|nr:3-phosphoshikimate 1-carboxyvinyltransferase [Tepidisphaeraceae bacterium]